MADDAGGVRARAPAGAERLERGAPADAAALHPRALPRGRARRCGAAVPGITFSTDIIVGFPGETEAQFEETLSLVTEADFDDAYTFKYSVREGTPAVRLTRPRARRGRVGAARAAHRGGPRATRAGRTSPASARRTRCWSSGPRAAATSCSAAPAPISSVLLDLPPSAAGEYHTCRLTGTTGSTFTGAVVTPALAVL